MVVRCFNTMKICSLNRSLGAGNFILQFAFVCMCAISITPTEAQTLDQQARDPIVYSGIVRAGREAVITPHIDGLLKTIHFTPNQMVKKGDLLFEFLTTESEINLEMDRSRLRQAEASLRLTEVVLANKKRLQQNNVSSKFELQQAQANYDIAAAKVAEAKAAAHKSDWIVKELKLVAPFDGMMSTAFHPEGIFLKRDRRSQLARIVQLDPVRVSAEAPFEFYYQRRLITKTDEATIKAIELSLILPNGIRYPHKGRLVSGGFMFDETTQKIRVLAEFPNPDLLLRPGLKVKLESRLKQQ